MKTLHLPRSARFDPGTLVATPGAMELIQRGLIHPAALLARHASGDWGDLDIEDRQRNEEALGTDDARLFSAYNGAEKVWVITDRCPDDDDYPITTILLPSEY